MVFAILGKKGQKVGQKWGLQNKRSRKIDFWRAFHVLGPFFWGFEKMGSILASLVDKSEITSKKGSRNLGDPVFWGFFQGRQKVPHFGHWFFQFLKGPKKMGFLAKPLYPYTGYFAKKNVFFWKKPEIFKRILLGSHFIFFKIVENRVFFGFLQSEKLGVICVIFFAKISAARKNRQKCDFEKQACVYATFSLFHLFFFSGFQK